LQVARQQPPRVDDLIDELELLPGLSDDRFTRPHAARFVEGLALDELSPADNAVQRAAQIVRNHAQIVVGKSVDLHRPLGGILATFGTASRVEIRFASTGHRSRICFLHPTNSTQSPFTCVHLTINHSGGERRRPRRLPKL
jgi:hypothetical protein